jgi:hypothetical protein
MIPDHLDAWLPAATIRTQHRRTSTAPPGRLWESARAVRLADPFTPLEESEHLIVSGLCGRIWTLARDYPRLEAPAAFRDWREPGTVRVLIAHWLEPLTDGRTEIVSEARVAAVDRTAAVRLRALWLVVGPFDHLVGAEGLTVAVRRAEGH